MRLVIVALTITSLSCYRCTQLLLSHLWRLTVFALSEWWSWSYFDRRARVSYRIFSLSLLKVQLELIWQIFDLFKQNLHVPFTTHLRHQLATFLLVISVAIDRLRHSYQALYYFDNFIYYHFCMLFMLHSTENVWYVVQEDLLNFHFTFLKVATN